MSGPILRRFALLCGLLVLAACAGQRTRLPPVDETSLARQGARETAMGPRMDWTLRGRLAVADAHDNGSGSLEWTQQGGQFRFSVHAPVTGKTWVLRGDRGHVLLEGLRAQAVEGDDAALLLERELGWRVPLADLLYWVRGLRAPGDARIEFRDDGLPAQIEQDGWKVRYLDYDTTRDPPLPSKVFASRGDYQVRLAIRDWSLQ
ncbi:MAG: lipoprotein insertase outer membrane protein LolB [Dokdonella sp.]|uniref:lipoprotein insertase outer membrane protein LolB n=1 Tax=Dokdonella sp. TaxID=2291710 RepID=UPI003F81EE86